ncbi:cell division protein CrgA [Nesterenkonia alba]|uniref:cell division protein CrgA n=1 Tax=Nesterenkonia alba TaxID=515814 RepID=UPI0003B6F5FE|nr:cell division protein CrgA [Nesterenkonia alba]
MPESKHRKNRGKRAKGSAASESGAEQPSDSPLRDSSALELGKDLEAEGQLPTWYKATMVGLLLVGLLWIVTWYVTTSAEGLPELPLSVGGWNIIIGFVVAMVGFFMMMRWK